MPTVCVVGPRDHGKSTLVRRLRGLPDLGQRAADGAEAAIVVLTGTGEVRLVDATDVAAVARVVLADPLDVPRGLVVVDATSGPARAGAALADLPLLGVRDIVVAVNKMDLAGWREDRYAAVRDALVGEADRLGLAVHAVVPVCARDATNVAERSATPWWRGPTLAGALDALPGSRARGGPLRLPVREVAERDGATLVVGRVESGSVKPGDDVLVLTTNRVTRVVSLEGTSVSAGPGEDARLVLADPLRLAPGDLIASPDSPAKLTAVFDADLWLFGPARDATAAVATGRRLTLVAGTREIGARISSVHDAGRGGRSSGAGPGGNVVRVTLRCDATVAVDDAAVLPRTGRVLIVDGGVVVGVGLVDARGYPDQRRARAHAGDVVPVRHQVVKDERASRTGHRGAVVWLTGLSGAGKSTLALALERRLFDLGWSVYTLDGDNVRTGLNADLGFSPEDRQENLRRVGEVAALFADAGLVCVTAFISPYRDERARARVAAGSHPFLEVWVRSPLEECERRDPKGLYRKARAGQLKEFTGIDSPYEPPDAADLVVDTAAQGIDECTTRLVDFVVAACRR
ncbi:MAG: adenylyl-sulfate kinase [Burkholderiales bacterium]